MRQEIPRTEWGAGATKRLYNRFQSMKSKAKSRQLPFSWQNFSEFLDDLIKAAPNGYHPDAYAIRFDSEIGYLPAGMRFIPSAKPQGEGRPSRTTVRQQRKQGEDAVLDEETKPIIHEGSIDLVAFSLELLNVLEHEEGDFGDLIKLAKDRAA